MVYADAVTWLGRLDEHVLRLPTSWPGGPATARFSAVVAWLTELTVLPGWRRLAAAPTPIDAAWAGGDAPIQLARDGAALAVPVAAWCDFVDEVFVATADALRAPGLTRAQAQLLVATANVHPVRCVFAGVDRTPTPWRHVGGPGMLDALVAQVGHDWPIPAPPEGVGPTSVTSGPPLDLTLDGARRDAAWLIAARAWPAPQFTYWLSATYVHGLVVSRDGACSWFRDLHHWPAASGAHAVRLVGRLEAFHAVALAADRPFGFDAGVLRPAG